MLGAAPADSVQRHLIGVDGVVTRFRQGVADGPPAVGLMSAFIGYVDLVVVAGPDIDGTGQSWSRHDILTLRVDHKQGQPSRAPDLVNSGVSGGLAPKSVPLMPE